jgi:hypothetical protein
MTGRDITLRQASLLSDGFAVYSLSPLESPATEDDFNFKSLPPYSSIRALHKIIGRLKELDLPGR